MNREDYNRKALPVAGILFMIVFALSGWNGTVAIVGGLLVGLVAVAGNWIAKP